MYYLNLITHSLKKFLTDPTEDAPILLFRPEQIISYDSETRFWEVISWQFEITFFFIGNKFDQREKELAVTVKKYDTKKII
jgi:glucan biosynthesis protein